MKTFLKKALAAAVKFATPARLAATVAALLFFWFLVLGDKGVNQIRLLLEMKHDLAAKQKDMEDSIERLSREKELLERPENLEMTIRRELGFIRPGEIIFEKRPPAEEMPQKKNN